MATQPVTIADGPWKGSTVHTARKAGKCAGYRHCGHMIAAGDRYVKGDPQYDIAGGFGHERLCLSCAQVQA